MAQKVGISKASIIAIIVVIVVVIAGIAGYVATRPAPTTTKPLTTPTTTATTPTTTAITTTPTSAMTPTTTKPKIKEVVIGCIEPLTGEFAVFGKEVVNGVKWAVDYINKHGGIKSLGGAKLKLVVEDAGETVESTRLAAEKLIKEHHPVMIEGTFMTYQQFALNDVAEKYKVLVISCSLGDEVYEAGYKYYIGLAPTATANGANLAKFLVWAQKKYLPDHPIHRVAILAVHEAYGEYQVLGFTKMLSELSPETEVVYVRFYSPEIRDFKPILDEVIAKNPDILVACSFFYDGVLLAKTIKELDWHPMFIAGMGASAFCDPDSIKAAGEAVEYYVNVYSYNPAKSTPTNKQFVEDYKKMYGKIPTEAAGIGSYNILTAAAILELAGEMFPDDPLNPEHIRAAAFELDLKSGPAVEVYPGDRIRFAPNGKIMDPANAVYQVINGSTYVVWPPEYAEREPVFPRPDWTPTGG